MTNIFIDNHDDLETILKKKYCIAIEWVIDILRGSLLFIERYVVI